jgi:hypothetical protein
VLQTQPLGIWGSREAWGCPGGRAWKGGNQSPRIFMVRRIEDEFWRAAFDDVPLIQNTDPVAQRGN